MASRHSLHRIDSFFGGIRSSIANYPNQNMTPIHTNTIKLTRLRFERYESGSPITHPTPRLSWRFESCDPIHVKSWIQASYILSISRCRGSKSGSGRTNDREREQERDDELVRVKIKSEQNILVPWPTEFPILQSRDRYIVCVKSTGVDGIETNWLKEILEVGLLNRLDWVGRMIGGGEEKDHDIQQTRRPTYLRKTFDISSSSFMAMKNDGSNTAARIYITAHGIYTLEINGHRIGNHLLSPGWQVYDKRLHYQIHDIPLSYLNNKGGGGVNNQNTIGIILAEGWFCGRMFPSGRNLWGSEMGVMMQLEIGGEVVVCSGDDDDDGGWEWGYGPVLTGELYDGERYDSRLEDEGWSGGGGVSGDGKNKWEWDKVRVLEDPKGKLIYPEAPPVREIMTRAPISIITTPSGRHVLDFGQNLVGWIRFLCEPSDTLPSGQEIVIRHAEVLENGEMGIRPLRTAKATDVYITGGKLKGRQPSFTFHGFRYAEFTGWKPSLSNVEAVVIHTDMEQTGTFECSHPMINRLHENVIWGTRGNFISVPTDCPQRDERLGWTGDLQVFAPTANFLFETSGMLGNWLNDVTAEQEKSGDGCPGLVVPDTLLEKNPFNRAQAVWLDVTVLTPRDLYWAFGDDRFVREQYWSMREWVEKGIPRSDTGLWDTNITQLGDWLAPDSPPEDAADTVTDGLLVADAYLVHVIDALSKLSDIIGEVEAAKRYRSEHQKLRQAFQDEYCTKTGRLSSDSQTAYALALRFDLLDQTRKPHAIERLAFHVNKRAFRVWTGFAGVNLLLQALADAGKLNLAYRMLQEKQCPSWLYPVSMGA